MKLIKRNNGIWYISFGRNKLKSTGTQNRAEAIRIFNAVKNGNINVVTGKSSIGPTLTDFKKDYLAMRKDKAEMTLIVDERAIDKFIECVGDIYMRDIKIHDIERFKMFNRLKNQSIKNTSINAYLRHLRTFLNKAHKLGLLSEKIEITLLKEAKLLPRFLDETEQKIITTYTKEHSPLMYRIIIFAIYTGCRVSEIISANYKNIIDDDTLKIIGKGDKERVIPLLDEVLEILENPRPKSGRIFPYRAEYISKAFKKIIRACKLEDDLHFHHLRHTTATIMIAKGVHLVYAQELLGHEDIRTTRRYSHANKKRLRIEMERMTKPDKEEM